MDTTSNRLGIWKWALISIGIAVLVVGAVPAYITWQQMQSSGQKVVSGEDITDSIARFIGESLQDDNTFVLYHECIKGSGCNPHNLKSSNAVHAISYLLRYSRESGSLAARAQADRAIQVLLDECQDNKSVCENYFYAFMTFHQETGDEQYLDAVRRATPSILGRAEKLEQSGFMARIVYTDISNKLAYLYEVTGEQRYADALDRLAAEILKQGYAAYGDSILYSHAGVDVYENAPLLAARVILPAYLVTKNPAYAAELEKIFVEAEPGTNRAHFLTSDTPLALIEYSINALTEMHAMQSDENRRTRLKTQESLLVNTLVQYRLDTPLRPLFDASNTFVTGTNAYVQRPQGVSFEAHSFKGVNENAYIGLILLDGNYEDAEFSLL